MKQRILSMLLVAVMVFTGVDITAFAQETGNVEVETAIEAEEETSTEEVVVEPVAEVEGEEMDEPNAEVTQEPVEEPVVEATQEPIEELVVEATQEPVEEPVVEATQETIVAPVVEVTQEPAAESGEEPIAVPEDVAVKDEIDIIRANVRRTITEKTILTEIQPGVYEKETQNVSMDLQMADEEDLPQLSMPTNLHWSAEHPGDICWDAAEDAEGCYTINIYKDGESFRSFGTVNWSGKNLDITSSGDIFESGTYTFEICTDGREGESASSEYAVCADSFVYERPSKEMDITSKLWWDTEVKTKGRWNVVNNPYRYDVSLLKDGSIKSSYDWTGESVDFVDEMTQAGKYSFTVRALSSDITKIANGQESAESPIYNTSLTTEAVDNTLDDALAKVEEDPDAAVEQIKDLDTTDLAVAMQTDENVLDRMKELEDAYAASKGIEVTTEVSDEIENLIDTSMISMTGVALNAAEDTTNMTMSFSTPDEGNEILIDGWQYRNTVQFNIDLNGEVYTDELSVPIRITIPVPEGLPQERLEILHYHRDGSYELVPLTLNYDGTVSFTVTSLSPFVFTEKITPITDISLSESLVTLQKTGDRKTVLLSIVPYEASTHMLQVESADESVVTVEVDDSTNATYGVIRVIITAGGKGQTTIKASTLDGKVEKELLVKVMSDSDEPEIGEFWVELPNGDDFTYTGKQIKPLVNVYDGNVLLQEKKDYTISYKNNIKVSTNAKKKDAPTITVKGIGNYTGTETVLFNIYKKDIRSWDVYTSDITVAYNKKVQKKVPVIYCNGKQLKKDKDFTVSYPDTKNNKNAYKKTGVYNINVTGKGGYTGTRVVKLIVTDAKLMSKVTVSKIETQPYTGEEVTTATMAKVPTVKYGEKTKLTEGVHYTVTYANNVKIGTATMILTGTDKETPEGIFTGTKVVNFAIGGTSLKNATVTGVPTSMVYTGQEINEQTEGWGEPIKVMLNGEELVRAVDEDSEGNYVVSFNKNVNKGTATVTVKGINAYSGSVKKEFIIKAYDINDNPTEGVSDNVINSTKKNLITEIMETDTVYSKGGSKPEPVVKFGDTILKKGTDYTLEYKNYTKWNDGSNPAKMPTVIITGKGNFKGSVKLIYTIAKQDISNLKITVPDVVYKKKKGAYKGTPVIKDGNKTLKVKTDYSNVYTYTYGEDVTLKNGTERKTGEKVGKNDIVPADTLIMITVTGKGNYSETALVGEYRVVKSSVSKATVTVPAQPYTGKSITIEDKAKIKVKIGTDKLEPEEFEIVDGSYKNNIEAGTASFTIKGVGNYGGTKKVTFKIKPKGLIWWWKNLKK